jgi:hypothetical protein
MPCPGTHDLGSERVDRGARRHDVVDDRDAQPGEVTAHAECVRHACAALPRSLARLRGT